MTVLFIIWLVGFLMCFGFTGILMFAYLEDFGLMDFAVAVAASAGWPIVLLSMFLDHYCLGKK